MSSLPQPDAALTEAVASLLAGVDGVSRRKMFGMPGFFVAGKCFACVMGDGLALKVGKDRAQALIDAGEAFPNIVMGRTMGGWVVVPADELHEQADLLDEAREVVQALVGQG